VRTYSVGWECVHRVARLQVLAVVLMLAGGTVWAQVTGTFCSVMASMAPDVTEFRLTIDNLNKSMPTDHT
jgi:hypothetical protein